MTKNISDTLKSIAKYEVNLFGAEPRVKQYLDESNRRGIDIVEASDKPTTGLTSFGTVGMSEFDNKVTADAKPLRVELLGVADLVSVPEFPNMLATCAFMVETGHYSITPGTILPGVVAEYRTDVKMRHFLCTTPSIWASKPETLEFDDRRVAWLMVLPVSDAELQFARQNGVDALERALENADVDVADFNRQSVV